MFVNSDQCILYQLKNYRFVSLETRLKLCMDIQIIKINNICLQFFFNTPLTWKINLVFLCQLMTHVCKILISICLYQFKITGLCQLLSDKFLMIYMQFELAARKL